MRVFPKRKQEKTDKSEMSEMRPLLILAAPLEIQPKRKSFLWGRDERICPFDVSEGPLPRQAGRLGLLHGKSGFLSCLAGGFEERRGSQGAGGDCWLLGTPRGKINAMRSVQGKKKQTAMAYVVLIRCTYTATCGRLLRRNCFRRNFLKNI